MKRIAIFFVLLLTLTITSIEGQARSKRPFNLTKPQRKTIEIEEKKFSFLLYKYDPPYLSPPYLLKSKEEADCSTPEGTNIALYSAQGRNKDWYLSLHDESGQKVLLDFNERSGGKVLEEYDKEKPLPDPLKEGNYAKFLYKIEVEIEDKKYTIVQLRLVFKSKEENYPSIIIFVKQDDTWLRTNNLDDHPITMPVGLKSYDDFLKLSHRAIPVKLIFFLIIVTLMAAFPVIRLILKRKAIAG